jgi:uncharacterized protein YecT (DUF1311 family)
MIASRIVTGFLALVGTVVFSNLAAAEGDLAYAREDGTELIFSPQDEKSFQIDIRHFAADSVSRVVYSGGTVEKKDDGTFHGEQAQESETGISSALILTVKGKPGDAKINFSAKGIQHYQTLQPLNLDGDYTLISETEILKRAEARFLKLDAKLNATYKPLKDSLSQEQQIALKTIQKAWIEYRDYMATGVERNPDENAPHNLAYWDEMGSQTATRLEFLSVYTGKGIAPGNTGEYEDFKGGVLKIAPLKSGLKFNIDVVRGPTYHLGNIEGVAKLNADKTKATWTDPNNAKCKVTITFSAGHIATVTAENTDEYTGARAYFDETYYKTSPKLK